MPYNRTALTKPAALSATNAEAFQLTDAKELEKLVISYQSGTRAQFLDLANKEIHLASTTEAGERHTYETLVIATGLSARKLQPEVSGAIGFRGLGDLNSMRSALTQVSQVLVIGSGVLGAEISSVLAARGLAVTMISRDDATLRRGFGHRATDSIFQSLERLGVLKVSGEIEAATHKPDGYQVTIQSGETHYGDLLITAIGTIPNTEWLADSGLKLNHGLVQTRNGLAAPDIWAIGDVSHWSDNDPPAPMQLQARAIAHAHSVAAQIVGAEPPLHTASYSWTEIAGTKVQAIGEPGTGDTETSLLEDGDRFLQLHTLEGQNVGLSSFGMPKQFTRARIQYEQSIIDRSQK